MHYNELIAVIRPKTITELNKVLYDLEYSNEVYLLTLVTDTMNKEFRAELLDYQLNSKHTVFCYFTRPDYIVGYVKYLRENRNNIKIVEY